MAAMFSALVCEKAGMLVRTKKNTRIFIAHDMVSVVRYIFFILDETAALLLKSEDKTGPNFFYRQVIKIISHSMNFSNTYIAGHVCTSTDT
jgi:hypothetical protein